MKLYGSLTSPYVRHCRIALLQGDLSAELINTNQEQSAQLTPTKRVPFLSDGDTLLSDSASIIRYIREQSQQSFLPTVEDLDQFCFVNTLLDSAANLFYLEKFGLEHSENSYTQRQQARILSSLKQLEESPQRYKKFDPLNDWHIRLACFLDWASFRHRITIENYPNLQLLVEAALQNNAFAQTRPTE